MGERLPTADPDALVEHLLDRYGEAFRSCVRYSPQSSTILYTREDIEPPAANSRLVRIGELYQSERLSARGGPDDDGIGALSASIHLFERVLVVHLLEPSGAAYGVSLDHGTLGDTTAFVEDCVEVLYGGRADHVDFG